MKELKELDLSENKISDIRALTNNKLQKLKLLCLVSNRINKNEKMTALNIIKLQSKIKNLYF